ncbi:hypothetical protein [Cypionkella sinensis]|uniref:Uncharacterized protein n=1 Tax=Cypionkella sinensis TaxID=1756043 RepID=A0ABV7J5J8_9RHOB
MRNDKLWQDIKAARSALATADMTLERAVSKSLRRTFELDPDKCILLMLEYRRFRYLHHIAEGPLMPSPLIAFIQTRDTPNSIAFAEIKRWWGGAARRVNTSLSSFVHEPAYQRTLELYQQEFAATPPYEIWPTHVQVQRKKTGLSRVRSGSHDGHNGSMGAVRYRSYIRLCFVCYRVCLPYFL